MRRMQVLILAIGLIVLVIMVGALSLANYRREVVSEETHEHGWMERDHGPAPSTAAAPGSDGPQHHADEPPAEHPDSMQPPRDLPAHEEDAATEDLAPEPHHHDEADHPH